MVKIINYKKRMAEDKEFFVLEVSGGIEMVMSKITGQFYATSKRAYVSSTFDEETCKALNGSEFPGVIMKQECEPYEYVNKDSGEVMMLSYRYVYTQEEATISKEDKSIQKLLAEEHTFSSNGHHKEEFVM